MSGSDDRLTPCRRPRPATTRDAAHAPTGLRRRDRLTRRDLHAGRGAPGAPGPCWRGDACSWWRSAAPPTRPGGSTRTSPRSTCRRRSAPTARPRRPRPTEAVNILLIGSDTREGAGNDAYADRDGTLGGGAHSDTNLLVHLSADRSSATVVSIPRDSMTPAPPDCSSTAPKDEWRMRQWNQNFAIGGTGCLIRTLEGNTGVFIDHYAVVDFRGFKQMVDALGGVEVCTPVAIDDAHTHLQLTRGQAHPRRAPGAAVRARAQVDRRRLRPAADRPPAGLPVLGGAEGDVEQAAAASPPSSTASSTPRPEVADHRPRLRGGHHARPGGQRQGHRPGQDPVRHGAERDLRPRPEPGAVEGARPSRSGRPCARTARSARSQEAHAPPRRRPARRSPSPPPTSRSRSSTPPASPGLARQAARGPRGAGLHAG